MNITLIGGGIAGLMLAYKAVSAGHAVTLYEAGHIASGASGKALGVLVPVTGLNRPIDILQREGIARWPALARQLAEETNTPLASFWRAWPSAPVAGTQQLNITTIFTILATAIRAKGGIIYENHSITNVNEVRPNADHIIVAAGYGAKALTGAPVTISTGIAARFTGHIDGLIAQDNLFLCPDFTENEVLAGSVNWTLKEPHTGPIPPEKQEELLRRVAVLAPHLQVKEIWLGNRPAQTPRTPLMTSPEPNLHVVTALGKIGMGVSPALELPF